MIILEEGNILHPQCPRCDMLVPWQALNRRHPATAQRLKGSERKRQRMAEEEMQERADRTFQAYNIPLEMVTSFKYLGRVLTAVGKDWSAVVENLRKAQKSCAWMTMILRREGAKPRVLGIFSRRWHRRC